MIKQLFATTAGGFEELLKTELEQLGATNCAITSGGVHFDATDEVQYRCLLWSRLASRILYPLSTGNIYHRSDLYALALNIAWKDTFESRSTFFVDFNGTNAHIRHSQYGAMCTKDAIVDYFEHHGFARPTVDKYQPDIRIHVYLHRDRVVISLDLSGDALHLRGYRTQTGKAPLRETLATAMVLRSAWQIGTPMVDPMCGSGTLLIEAAQIQAQIAPQLYRKHWGFDHWKGHNVDVWQQIKAEAEQKKSIEKQVSFYGFDLDAEVLQKAKYNAQQAGVAELIQFQQRDISLLDNPCPQAETGMVICNPPYGERLGATPILIALYSVFGQRLKHSFVNWQASILSSEPELLNCLGLRAFRQFKMKNGPLNCVQKNYKISSHAHGKMDYKHNITDTPLVAISYANRLQKNIKKIERWATQQKLDAYRLYDADLPEYNFAVDRYGDYIVIQEYAAPKKIEVIKTRQRLLDAVQATLAITGISASHLVLKVREKQKGKNQYEKLAEHGEYFFVHEYGAKLWVNLTDYLDTGLFLDHRLTRKMLGEMAKEKDFLNLFAYTGSATVQAILGGAKTTTSVDMSNTYLNWAEQNQILNDIQGCQHKIIQSDCLQWLQHCKQQFDLIFVDPPTFSNSKRMQNSWDVQRDHLDLFGYLKNILRSHGIIVFSNNKRGFKIDLEGLAQLGFMAENISEKTLPLDFARNKHIHNTWLVKWME